MILKKLLALAFTTTACSAFLVSCDKNADFVVKPLTEVNLRGARLLADSIYLDRDTVYVLNEDLNRNAGQLLQVEAGTLVKVSNNRGIVINAGGKLIANGTQNQAIVFTSDALKGTGGYAGNFWSGIQINGMPDNSSGSLGFLGVEYSQGMSFVDVDPSTTIHNIQVSYAVNSAAFIFTGGTTEAKNLVAYASGGTDFILNGGFTGKMQNVLAYRHPLYPVTSYSPAIIAGMHITGVGTSPIISNLSVIGPDPKNGTSPQYLGNRAAAVVVSDNATMNMRNCVLAGFPKGALYVESREAAISLQQGISSFAYSIVQSYDSSRTFYIPTGLVTIPGAPPITASVFRQFMLSSFLNTELARFEELQLTDPYNYEGPVNILPGSGSPLLIGADFNNPIFNFPFFEPVTYKGATGAENWLQGWTNFIPSRTDYNK